MSTIRLSHVKISPHKITKRKISSHKITKRKISPHKLTKRKSSNHKSTKRKSSNHKLTKRKIKLEKTAERCERNLFVPQYMFPNPTIFSPIVKCRMIKTREDYTHQEKSLIIDYIHYRKYYDIYDPKFKIPNDIHYIDTNNKSRKTLEIELNLHHGQRKLLISLVKCIIRLVPDVNRRVTICYAGSAPGYNIPWLLDLFPTIHMWCYDPAPFCDSLIKHPRAKCFNEFFTDDLAKEWSIRSCDIFISDIRLEHDNRQDFNKAVSNDNLNQTKWVQIIRPRLGAMLKYRPPYVTDYSVELKDTILDGILELQVWPPTRSTETRHIIGPPPISGYKTMTIDCTHYDKFFYVHNLISRNWLTFDIPSDSKDVKFVQGYDRCYDCTNEMLTWRKYLNRRSRNLNYRHVGELMNNATRVVGQRLNMPPKKSFHGVFPSESRCSCRDKIWNLSTLR